MNLYHWVVGRFSTRKMPLAVYKRGVAKAKRHQHQAAIVDYTSAIGMSQVPADVKAMALYNRTLAYVSIEEFSKGAKDLKEVLAMPNAPTSIKTEATRKLVRMQQRVDRNEPKAPNHD